jgi:hypothetical protein
MLPESNVALMTLADLAVLVTITTDTGKILAKLHQVEPCAAPHCTALHCTRWSPLATTASSRASRSPTCVSSTARARSTTPGLSPSSTRRKWSSWKGRAPTWSPSPPARTSVTHSVSSPIVQVWKSDFLRQNRIWLLLVHLHLHLHTVQGEDGSGAGIVSTGGGGFEFDVDSNDDPELALALRSGLFTQIAFVLTSNRIFFTTQSD